MTSIREGTADEAALLARLHAACFAETWSAEFFATLLGQPGVRALIAGKAKEKTGEDVGFILIRTVAGEAEILTFAVAPRARRRGIGRTLAVAAGRIARDDGAERMFLEVAVRNQAARALYERLGFAAAGYRKGYYRTRKNGMQDEAEDALVLTAALPLEEKTASQDAGNRQDGREM